MLDGAAVYSQLRGNIVTRGNVLISGSTNGAALSVETGTLTMTGASAAENVTIASGATQLNFLIFMVASLLARGLRFFLVAGLLYWFGRPVRDFIEQRLGLVTTIFTLLLVGGFIVIKYLV